EGDARAVDGNIQTALRPQELVHRLLPSRLRGYVQPAGPGRPTAGGDGRGRSLGPGGVEVGAGDRGALGGHGSGRGPTDPAPGAGPGHQGDLARDPTLRLGRLLVHDVKALAAECQGQVLSPPLQPPTMP